MVCQASQPELYRDADRHNSVVLGCSRQMDIVIVNVENKEIEAAKRGEKPDGADDKKVDEHLCSHEV